MPKSDPSTWAPSRPGQCWSYTVLRDNVREFDIWCKSNGKGEPEWEFWLDRKLEDGEGGQISQTLTKPQFIGDDRISEKWPIPGMYYADVKLNGESVLREPWRGVHFDEDARAERRGAESMEQVVRLFVNDQFTRMTLEITDLRRQLEGDRQRAKKLQHENDEYVDALAGKDRDILALKRERDADQIAREEAEAKMEAAIQEKQNLLDEIESLREPLRMIGAGFVEEAFTFIGVPKSDGGDPEGLPEAVRAAAERITMAVLRCPEAQDVLDLSVDPETEEPFWGPDDSPIEFLLEFFREVQKAQAAQADGGINGRTYGGAPPPEAPAGAGVSP